MFTLQDFRDAAQVGGALASIIMASALVLATVPKVQDRIIGAIGGVLTRKVEGRVGDVVKAVEALDNTVKKNHQEGLDHFEKLEKDGVERDKRLSETATLLTKSTDDTAKAQAAALATIANRLTSHERSKRHLPAAPRRPKTA